jgi:hypothetical protein
LFVKNTQKVITMPTISTPVQPYVNPPYRQKIVEAGGLRQVGDWSQVVVHCQHSGSHLLAHGDGDTVGYEGDEFADDSVVIEIHEGTTPDGISELENCKMTSFTLGPIERAELAAYLINTL